MRTESVAAESALALATRELAELEESLKAEEATIDAALRAIADQREGTARQEGHIKSLAARLEANAEEIARLTSAKSEAQSRVDQAKTAYSKFEMEIAGADAGELGLDSQFEIAKGALDETKKKHADLIESERATDRERNAVESKLEAMRLTSQSRDGGAALIRDSQGLNILGSIASLIQVDSGWEAATAAANAAAILANLENKANADAFANSALGKLAAQYAADTAAASVSAYLNTGGGADARYDQRLAANYAITVNAGVVGSENVIVDAVLNALNEIARRGNLTTYAGAIAG